MNQMYEAVREVLAGLPVQECAGVIAARLVAMPLPLEAKVTELDAPSVSARTR
jgi:hypothetical protein